MEISELDFSNLEIERLTLGCSFSEMTMCETGRVWEQRDVYIVRLDHECAEEFGPLTP